MRFAGAYAGGKDLRETVPSETQLDESIEAVLNTELEPGLDAYDSTAADTVSAKCLTCTLTPSDCTC